MSAINPLRVGGLVVDLTRVLLQLSTVPATTKGSTPCWCPADHDGALHTNTCREARTILDRISEIADAPTAPHQLRQRLAATGAAIADRTGGLTETGQALVAMAYAAGAYDGITLVLTDVATQRPHAIRDRVIEASVLVAEALPPGTDPGPRS